MSDLRSAGWTQKMLAERTGAAQATIADLARGATREPGYALGKSLAELHKRIVRARAAAAAE